MSYLNWDTKIITDFSTKNIESLYDQGYVFTRVDRGILNKTRSLRIDLSHFEASSENRRVLRKSEHLTLTVHDIPYTEYSWEIAKLAKDFYATLGADFSANKVRDILTTENLHFNKLLVYTDTRDNSIVGYAIAYESDNLLHYSYPFYIEKKEEPSRGLGMMMLAINYAKDSGKKYIYLGSLQRPTDTYKLQFKGMEWFDGEKWQFDTAPLKDILK
jgi:arginyl-tRNA--protein-N-Asp/Glu arginylyltransferase